MYLTFANTVLLIGLAGAVVPLVLHLLSRARYRSVDWGAMLFLEGIEFRQHHSTRLNQWMLLLLRMGVIAALAMALAQPILQEWGPDAGASVGALRVADRGQLLCLSGAVGCGAISVTLLLMAIAAGRDGRRMRFAAYVALAVTAVIVAVVLGRRASAWNVEITRLVGRQPQDAMVPTAEGGLRGRLDAAILLDCSSSMNFEENGHTRFALAQGAAKQVLSGLRSGDRVTLLLLGQREPDSELEPTADLQSVADRIDNAHPGHEPVDIAAGLIKAQEVLDRGGSLARNLYLVSDRQAMNWRNVDDHFITHRWPESLQRSGATVRLYIVPVGNSDSDNIAVENVELANPPAIVGQPADVEVEVHNYGSTPRAAVPLTIWVNGRVAAETTVSIAPGQVARVSTPVKSGDFATAGPQVVSAEIRTTGYRDDDRLDVVVEALEPVRVLIISGDEWEESTGQFRNESDFIRLALSPLQTLRHRGADPCKVDVIPADRWAQTELGRYQVVILANIERFSDWQSRDVEQYVYGGGGVIIAPGSLARVSNYNDQLWREGAGILPAPLEEATPSDGAEATSIVGYDPTSPIFHFLHDQPDLMLTATIGRFFPTGSRSSESRIFAWYTSGFPFVMESPAGRGKVLLITTSLDADWSTLPLSSLYLPFMQSSVRYLAAGTMPSRNRRLGEAITVACDDPVDDRATIDLPDGDQRSVPLAHSGGVIEARFSETSDPGIYRIHVKERLGDRVTPFAVQAAHNESDLTELSDKKWDELESSLHINRIDSNDRGIAAFVARSREGYELWPWAIGSVLLLAAGELGLARYWSKDAY